jgi:DNA-binding response OmpR family regulator
MNDGINHILVCDDEEDIREMFAEYLARRGYRISTADGAEALREAVAGDRPDLILLDVNMPGEDGLSVLKSLQVEPRVPVIMLTAAGEVIDRIIGLELGAEDYLGKPVDLRELEARIKVVLRRPLGHTGKSRHVPVTMHRISWPSMILRKISSRVSEDPRGAPGRNGDRIVVAG